jgi:hypothetical protein
VRGLEASLTLSLCQETWSSSLFAKYVFDIVNRPLSALVVIDIASGSGPEDSIS